MKAFRYLTYVSLWGAVLLAAPAVTAAGLEWEIANRFRLFRKEQHFRELLRIYSDVLTPEQRSNEPALALETALQVAASKALMEQKQRIPPKQRSLRLDSPYASPDQLEYFGWTWALSRPENNCYRHPNRNHYTCQTGGQGLMDPVSTTILVRLESSIVSPAGAQCLVQAKWQKGSKEALQEGRGLCAGPDAIRVPNVPFDTPFTLTVKNQTGQILAEASEQLAQHFFIVGMGDSFAAGEGNPDRPVQLSDRIPDDYGGKSTDPNGHRQHYPIRLGRAAAQTGGNDVMPIWLNPQCHRSLYSYQLRTTLVLALEQPHAAVTFTNYACTGAEIAEGLLGYHVARGDDVAEARRDDAPQLVKMLRDYCATPRQYEFFTEDDYPDIEWNKWDTRKIPRCARWRSRPPHAILLSIGGNDVGFSRVIAELVVSATPETSKRLYDIWLNSLDPLAIPDARAWLTSNREDENYPESLEAKHAILARVLAQYSGGSAHVPTPVLQTAYPQLTRGTKAHPGDPCGQGRKGYEVHASLGIGPKVGAEGIDFVKVLNQKLGSFVHSADQPPNLLDWSFVDAHVARFSGHAICAGGIPDEFHGASWGAVSGNMGFPLARFVGNTVDGFASSPFQPSEWRAYRPRQRWFVTPNDGFLTGHYLSTSYGANSPVQPLIAATLSGSFHPNALGQAAMADATLVSLRAKLKLHQPSR